MQELSIVLLGDIRLRYPSLLHVIAVLPLLSYRDAFCREGVRKHGGFVTTEVRISLCKPTCLLWAHNQTASCNYKEVWFHWHRSMRLAPFLKVLRFSFPVPVVSPGAKDFYPLRRAKFTGGIFLLSQVLSKHQSFYRYAFNQTRSRHMKCDLNRFDPNSIMIQLSCLFLAGCIPISFYRLYLNLNTKL